MKYTEVKLEPLALSEKLKLLFCELDKSEFVKKINETIYSRRIYK